MCSKLVQTSDALPWEFPKAIDSIIHTLDACLDNLSINNFTSSSLLESKISRNLCNSYEIMGKKEYQECPLMDVPISTARTRSKFVDFDSDDVLNCSILKYNTYISELKKQHCG